VQSIANDLFLPLSGYLIGGVDCVDACGGLRRPSVVAGTEPPRRNSLEVARTAGATVFAYGRFINIVIVFFMTTFILMLLVKWVSQLQKPAADSDASSLTRQCPECISMISKLANRCPNCTSVIGVYKEPEPEMSSIFPEVVTHRTSLIEQKSGGSADDDDDEEK
jgi:large conductance mechanosensitive channel